MAVLEKLEPEKVFHYFERICSIPHGSGNIERISDYLAEFARRRGIECYQDELRNIVMIKEASEGYEKEEPVILQGHMDMVAVKKPECDLDMTKEGLRLAVDGDFVYARGTSLGGDDGIAVAFALALLDDESISHPRLEVIITVEEEVGMEGASGIDLSMLKGSRMINLDSEEEGIFLTSCAGGGKVRAALPVQREAKEGVLYEVTLGGLEGGHSGTEIIKERGNSNCLTGRLLQGLLKRCDYSLVSLEGGLADNAIPRETKAELVVAEASEQELLAWIKEYEAALQRELAVKDPGAAIAVRKKEKGVYRALTKDSLRRAAALIFNQPNGVQAMSADIKGLVQTSLNLGVLKLSEKELTLDSAVRSSVSSEKTELLEKLASLAELTGAKTEVSGEYPAWEYRQDSPLRDKMVRVYEDRYGDKPKIEAIHAGLECGILAGKIKDLDCVSIGPDMSGIHTTEEKLSIASTKRVWEFLLEVLRRKERSAP